MADRLVTVFGGGGFIGRYAVRALLQTGARVRIAERHPKNAWYLKAQADLGQIAWCAADITKADSVARAIEGADAVVNLVGRFDDMDAIHVVGAGNIADAAARAGVGAMVHVSAIGADPASGSNYGRTKGEGEAAVRSAFPEATILRPSIIFGREDAFINRFAALMRMLPVVPVIGGKAKFQPVYVGDVGRAVAVTLLDPAAHGGKTFELGGPQIISMRAINEWIAARTGRSRLLIDVPDAVAGALASLTGWMPGAPVTADQWAMLQSDNVVAPDARGLSALGIEATALDSVAPGWLVQYKRHGRFGAAA